MMNYTLLNILYPKQNDKIKYVENEDADFSVDIMQKLDKKLCLKGDIFVVGSGVFGTEAIELGEAFPHLHIIGIDPAFKAKPLKHKLKNVEFRKELFTDTYDIKKAGLIVGGPCKSAEIVAKRCIQEEKLMFLRLCNCDHKGENRDNRLENIIKMDKKRKTFGLKTVDNDDCDRYVVTNIEYTKIPNKLFERIT